MKKHGDWHLLHFQSSGGFAFILHRLSGIGLVAYLYLHLVLLDKLRHGPQAWDSFVQLMRSPWLLGLDAVLLFGILIHGLNGLRLTLIGFGAFLRWQRVLFWVGLFMAVVLTIWGILAMQSKAV